MATVDSLPSGDGPPSKIRSICPPNSCTTSSAVRGDGWPETLALVPMICPPHLSRRFKAVSCLGMRNPTNCESSVTAAGSFARNGTIRVRGPGQNLPASASEVLLNSPNLLAATMEFTRIGSAPLERCFAWINRSTASPSRGLQPSPCRLGMRQVGP